MSGNSSYCRQCKLWNPPDAVQCLKCGRMVAGGTPPPASAPAAVAKLPCPKCRFLNVASAQRCLQCSTPLDAARKVSSRFGPVAEPEEPTPSGRFPRPTAPPAQPAGPPPTSRPMPGPARPMPAPPRPMPPVAGGRPPAPLRPPPPRISTPPTGRPAPATARGGTPPSERPTRPLQAQLEQIGGLRKGDSVILRGETVQLRREDVEAEMERQAAPAEMLKPPVANLELNPGDTQRALAWLCCDPFSPVPIGTKPVLTLGRGADCDMILPHESVSRVHAVVRSVGREMVLEDRSTYGTYLNGERVRSRPVAPGDTLRLGPYEIAVRIQPGRVVTEDETKPLRTFETSEAMQGRLEKVSLAEVLQQIEFNEKTGTLRVWTDDLQGQLTVYQGKPIWAELGDLDDEDAVIAMLKLERGNFSFMAKVEPGEQSMHGTLTAILLEASRRQDEG